MQAGKILVPGRIFNRLTVLEYLGPIARKRRYRVRCECGTEKVVAGADLLSKTVTSCGCFRRDFQRARATTHGQGGVGRTYLYRAWEAMWDRTESPRPSNPHKSYIERGIMVAEVWRAFEPFRDYVDVHLGKRPQGHSLDRIDNDRGYEPGNVRWATAKQQQRNTSHNTIIAVDGVSRCIAEWAEVNGISSSIICTRRKRGWPDHLAVTMPAGSAFNKRGRRPIRDEP